ncbi:hypothetical protein NIES21_20940 [Anabaenopsis circularis NIES-21]|uniref:Uncharacterized protein n=1 Tax=Anabaenopsis circularis NIES-21 TaxID=1085406 RepID=A0A1Z4GFK7_9CYAN|nr:hypothetical protein NIES21_20940 [Anabaenopsis circularis NIES-21]
MEHWQFLIQKQGNRSWHTLESPNIQILEGRYRVLARSDLPNTDVEVRVTHSSTQEVPPKRRIQKQSRRTTSEGLMAVIPFTLLKPGIWELRCSGDLMSDIFGKSWQQSVYLQVLSTLADGEIDKLAGGGNLESNSQEFFMVPLPYTQNFDEPDSSVGKQPISLGSESHTQSNLVTNELSAEIASIASDDTVLTTAEEFPASDSVISEETLPTSDRIPTTTEEFPASDAVISGEALPTSDRIPTTTEEFPASDAVISGEALPTSDRIQTITEEISVTDSVISEETLPTSDRIPTTTEEFPATDSVISEEALPTSDRIQTATEEIPATDAVVSEETLPTSDHIPTTTEEFPASDSVISEEALPTSDRIQTATEEITDSELSVEETVVTDKHTLSVVREETPYSSLVISQLSAEKYEDGMIDQPVNPVWLKGETAEQILQSLIDQALPTSLLEDEQLEEVETIQPVPPLRLTLEQENYVARWGQGLSINAYVELQTQPNLEDEPQYSTTFHALEVKIELRSPLSSGILAQVRQPLADNLLPFTINSAINIPIDCESKLLLGELSLYGAISDFDDVILLASRSFTITADVTELLAMAAVTKSSQQNFLDNSSVVGVSPPNQEPETSVSLGLELFNLVKTSLTQPQTILPSPNQPLPEQINLFSLKKSGDLRSPQLPQLPKFPENQTGAIAINDDLTEVTAEGKEEIESQDNGSPSQTTIPLAPINLEQLSIKTRPGWMLGNIFPYLKRLKSVPVETTEETNNLLDVSEPLIAEDSLADVSEPLIAEDSQLVEPAITADENLDVDDSVLETSVSTNSELFAVSMLQMAVTPSLEFSDDSISEPAAPLSSELIAEVNPYSSPLIRKWMQSQGYVVPELPPVPEQNHQIEVVEPEIAPVAEKAIESDLFIPSVDVQLSSNLDTDLENLDGESEENIEEQSSLGTSELQDDTGTSIITEASEELNISAEVETENIPQELSTYSLPLTQLPLTQKIKIPRAWLGQEIVVDDTYSDPEEDFAGEQKQQSISAVSNSLPVDGEMLEALPTPQLYIPEGELIAGQSVRVRVELPEVPPQVVVKLWIEDCQTRGLLDGPHLLKDLLPKALGGVEVMTQINIPFGCVEIRLEAIAFHPSTQQESHKATTVRTVIPPDLPNYQLDELLGL